MDNYYETCLTSIQSYMEDGLRDQALTLLDQELTMPYVPEPYYTKFLKLRDELHVNRTMHARFFEDMDAISEALLGNDALKQKALFSLERMNLRSVENDLKVLLEHEHIEDWIKKQLLLMMMYQDMQGEVSVVFDAIPQRVNLATLVNPIGSDAYLTCLEALVKLLESENPSMLMLCQDALDDYALSQFPQPMPYISAQEIVKTVEGYLQ